jgi:hypothetical protein
MASESEAFLLLSVAAHLYGPGETNYCDLLSDATIPPKRTFVGRILQLRKIMHLDSLLPQEQNPRHSAQLIIDDDSVTGRPNEPRLKIQPMVGLNTGRKNH